MNKFLLVLMFFTASVYASAQDRYFAQTYTSTVLPKGAIDLELWHSSRFGHAGQYFHAMDQRAELEIGLGKNFQTAFYFNRFQKTFTNGAETVTTSEIGFSNEWKWKLSDASAHKLGTALYTELGVKGDELELETKLILDKSFGKNLLALNLVNEIEEEMERENGETELETEATPFEVDLAYMRNLSTSWGIGVELRSNNQVVKGKWQNSVLYAGPTVNYRGDRWFLLVNYLPQIRNLHQTAAYPASKVLDDRERSEVRILVGISF